VRLSEIGAILVRERQKLVLQINDKLTILYKDLAHSEAASVHATYTTGFDIDQYSSALLQALEKRQAVDLERGFTTVGPHRDDLTITFGKHQASQVASRGETRTVLLALKVIELQLIEETRGVKPLLLLDDVFSELDGARRRALTEVIGGYQTFITTTDADVVVQHFMDRCAIIPTSSNIS
jgi:DNA replication and repair protein RecF